jgi:hypothetical protein
MGILEHLFGKPREKKLESWRQAQIEANKAVEYTPERTLTDVERAMAQAVIRSFKELFSDQVFCTIKPSSTYDYKIFKQEDGEVVYGHDLSEIEGPFLVTMDQLKDKVFKSTAQQSYDEHNTGKPDYQSRLFVFRKGKNEVLFYADNNGIAEFNAAELSI